MIVELYINDVAIDVAEDIVFPLTYSISDVKEPNKRKRNTSKTIVLPGTKNNNNFFSSAYDLSISNVRNNAIGFNYDPTLRYPCRVLRDGKEIFRGSANLQKVVSMNKVNSFEIVLYSEITNLFQALGDVTVAELGWSDYDFTLSVANIQSTWNNTGGSGVVVPLIDYGFTDDEIYYDTNDLRPFVFVQEIIEKCFSRSGFTLSGGFFSNARNKKLIWGSGGGEILTLSTSDSNDRLVDYDGTGTTAVVVPANGFEFTGGLGFNATNSYFKKYNISDNAVISITQNQDNLLQMNEDNGEIVIANSGNYKLSVTSSIDLSYSFSEITALALFFGIRFELRIFRNGAKLDPITQHNINETVAGTSTFSLNLSQEFELISGDIVEANFYISTTGTKSEFGAGGDLNLGVTFNSINIELTSYDSEIIDGDTVNIARFLPKMKASDFMQDMITMFNLYMNNPDDDGNILLLPIDQYYYDTDDVDQWSDKIDNSKNIEIMPAANIQGKTYAFEWAKDRDYYKQLYFETYGEGEIDYGDNHYNVPSTYKVGTKKYQLKIAQSVPVQIADTNIIIPKIYKYNEASGLTSPHKGKPRMFFFSEKRACDDWYLVNSATGAATLNNVYPVAHHLDDLDAPTFDLNFGVPYYVYYTATAYTTINLFSQYHAQFIRELTSKDSKVVNAFFHLKESDLYENFQRRLCNIDGVIYRKNVVKDYRATGHQTTKVELVKIVDGDSRKDYDTNNGVPFEPVTDGVGGGGNPGTGTSGGIEIDTTIRNSRSVYIADTTAGPLTFTLNNTTIKKGKEVTIVNQNGLNPLIITAVEKAVQGNYSPTINGSTDDLTLSNANDSVTIRFDGANYLITSASGSYSTDHHSGFKTIDTNETVVIAENKQMTNFNKLTNNGTLDIKGDLILK